MKKHIQGILFGAAVAVGLSGFAGFASAEPKMVYKSGDRISSYIFTAKETNAIQDDDFANPAFLWTDEGEALWNKVDGKAGKSCATCHGVESAMLSDVGTRYPVYNPATGKMQNLEQKINVERKKMGAKPYKYESKQMLSLTIYMKNQSRGKPMNVSIDGAAAPFFAAGKAFYEKKRGQLDMSCANCHEDNEGKMIRANLLSQGQSNGFPLYRLKWQKPGSLHRRFRGCNKQVRAKPYGYGSNEYVNLELYLGWRARGLSVETPAVRM